jgi:hypothetical protein
MKYINQKNEINDGENFCGASTVAMITGEIPQSVANVVGPSAPDDTLTKYLKFHDFNVKQITWGGTKESDYGYTPGDKDFNAMRKALDNGEYVLYHFAGWDKKSSGHYALVTGYVEGGFIFNDPAGDRNSKYFGKTNEGEQVEYSTELLIKAGMKRLFSVKEKE